ncbi:Uma2 family endonuclease [Synechocystis sp. LKSZ1]|uniref:Uma2 family endonuclease n=1 Tax=Synechocystis sp. LKSZ1 TaxID=3144951 RepID=UPI00336BF491
MTLNLEAQTIPSQDIGITTEVSHRFPGETWVEASWSDFLQATEQSDYSKGKFYYYQSHLRIEMPPIGNDHASDHSIIISALHLYACLQDIPLNLKDNCSYRKPGYQEAQPDISGYLGENTNAIPYGTGVVNLEEFPAPSLVVEIANTSLVDDQEIKRLLYEELGIQEYWIVNVKTGNILAFRMENQGSYRIQESQILPNLKLSILEEALRMTRNQSHSHVMKWLMNTLNPLNPSV